MRTTSTGTVEIVKVDCDVCGRNVMRYQRCWGCGIDVCTECSTVTTIDPHDAGGDSEPRACGQCSVLAEASQQLALAACDRYDTEIDRIEKEWKAACVAARSTPKESEMQK